jgi:hypothetical protein
MTLLNTIQPLHYDPLDTTKAEEYIRCRELFPKEGLSEYEQQMIHNLDFWEHFTDHLMMVSAFIVMGLVVFLFVLARLNGSKFFIDYTLEDGKVIRMPREEGCSKRVYLANPQNFLDWCNVFTYVFFDRRGRGKNINKKDRIRMRRIRNVVLAIVALAIFVGFLYVMSASEIDYNPYNWIKGYRPWE